MRKAVAAAVVVVLALASGVEAAAKRHWQSGTLTEARSSGAVRRYVLDAVGYRFELEEKAVLGRQSLDVTVGAAVTFSVTRQTIYVRGANGVEYKLHVVKKIKQARPPAAAYLRLGEGHRIRGVSAEGRYVTLEDGSLWEIHPRMRWETAEWEPLDDVTVRAIPELDGFTYELDNATDDDRAAAKYIPAGPAK